MDDGLLHIYETEVAFKEFLDNLCPDSGDRAFYRFLNVKPQAKQSVRFGGGRAFTDPKKKAYVNDIAAKVSPYADSMRFTGPVHIGIVYCFNWRKSDKVTDRSILREMTARPDLDNLQKPLFDGLTLGGMFSDDATIVRCTAVKVRWLFHGIAIKICSSSANDYTIPLLDTSL